MPRDCIIDPRLVIRRLDDIVKPRVYYSLPVLGGDSSFGIYNNSVDVAALAMTERQLNLKVGGVLTTPTELLP